MNATSYSYSPAGMSKPRKRPPGQRPALLPELDDIVAVGDRDQLLAGHHRSHPRGFARIKLALAQELLGSLKSAAAMRSERVVDHVRRADLIERIDFAGGGDPVEALDGRLVLVDAHSSSRHLRSIVR